MKKSIEDKIQEKGLNAPRLNPQKIQSVQGAKAFHVFPDTMLTVCVLTLVNGFTVTGESACVSPENFNAEIGREVAEKNAVEKIWALEGYLLKQRLFEQSKETTFIERLAVELEELGSKIKKLQPFIESKGYKKLSLSEQQDLLTQCQHMQDYHKVLSRRFWFYAQKQQ